MLQVVLAFVGGVFTLIPAMFVSPRRRLLGFIREEAEILKGLPEGAAKKRMEESLAATAETYRRRVKGLDRVEILRRRVFVMVPVAYAVITLGFFLLRQVEEVADYLGVKESTVWALVWVVEGLVFVPMVVTIVQYLLALRDRQQEVHEAQEEFEGAEARREAARRSREALERALSARQRRDAEEALKVAREIVKARSGLGVVMDPSPNAARRRATAKSRSAVDGKSVKPLPDEGRDEDDPPQKVPVG